MTYWYKLVLLFAIIYIVINKKGENYEKTIPIIF